MTDRTDRSTAQKLRDAFLAHAVFLEGVRNWQGSLFKPTAAAIAAEIRKILADLRMDFKDATKKQVALLVRRLRNMLLYELTNFKTVLLQELQTFLASDLAVFKFLLATITDVPYVTAVQDVEDDKTKRKPLFAFWMTDGTEDGTAALWASIAKMPVPANGFALGDAIDAFNDYAIGQVIKTVNVAYANNTDTEQLEAVLLTGDKESGAKPVLDRLTNGARTAGSTAFGFVSTQANQAVSSIYAGQYQWCSVLDSRTTEICQSRADQVYTYGEGPQPPAHENCRSTIIPYDLDYGDADTTQSFTSWLDGLPAGMRDEMFTQSAQDADQVNPVNAKLLSVDDFEARKTAMLQ